jgi:hypothetical protein
LSERWRGIIFPRPRPAVARSGAYRAIPARADGTADLSTTVPVALNPGLQYNVALFASHN